MFIAVCLPTGIGLTPTFRTMEGETSVIPELLLCVFSFYEIYVNISINTSLRKANKLTKSVLQANTNGQKIRVVC